MPSQETLDALQASLDSILKLYEALGEEIEAFEEILAEAGSEEN